MKCINCYREIKDGLKFCNYCGSKQPKDREAYEREHPELADAMPESEVMEQIKLAQEEQQRLEAEAERQRLEAEAERQRLVQAQQSAFPNAEQLAGGNEEYNIPSMGDSPQAGVSFFPSAGNSPAPGSAPSPAPGPAPSPVPSPVAPSLDGGEPEQQFIAPVTPVVTPRVIPRAEPAPVPSIQPAMPGSQSMPCPECGTPLPPMASTCPACGYSIGESTVLGQSLQPVQPVQPMQSPSVPVMPMAGGTPPSASPQQLQNKVSKNKSLIIAAAVVIAVALIGGIIYALNSGGQGVATHSQYATSGTDGYQLMTGITSTSGSNNGGLVELGSPIKLEVAGSGDMVDLTAVVTLKRTSKTKVNHTPPQQVLTIAGRDADNSHVSIILNADSESSKKILQWLYQPAGTATDVKFKGRVRKQDLDLINHKSTNNTIKL